MAGTDSEWWIEDPLSKEIGIDYLATMRRLGGSRELFEQYVTFFVEDSVDLLQDLSASVDRGDRESAARAAHSIKGLVSAFGAAQVVDTSAELQRVCTAGEFERARSAIESLRDQVQQLTTLLEQYRNRS